MVLGVPQEEAQPEKLSAEAQRMAREWMAEHQQ
jgi:hypothetical protein